MFTVKKQMVFLVLDLPKVVPDQTKLPMRNADAFSPYGHWI